MSGLLPTVIISSLVILCFTHISFSKPLSGPCSLDRDCGEGRFCNGRGICSACVDCASLNRNGSAIDACPKNTSYCGPCLTGFVEDPSSNLSPCIKESKTDTNYNLYWLLLLVLLLLAAFDPCYKCLRNKSANASTHQPEACTPPPSVTSRWNDVFSTLARWLHHGDDAITTREHGGDDAPMAWGYGGNGAITVRAHGGDDALMARAHGGDGAIKTRTYGGDIRHLVSASVKPNELATGSRSSELFTGPDSIASVILTEEDLERFNWAAAVMDQAKYPRATAVTSSVLESVSSDGYITREQVLEKVKHWREAATVFFETKKKCFEHVKSLMESRLLFNNNTSTCYELKRWCAERIELANQLAATQVLTSNRNSTTLDLHFLRVKEANEVVNIFIDAHVAEMREVDESQRCVEIITGRGRHSQDGRSKIRPSTVKLLERRSVSYSFLNPGLLSAILTKQTPLSHEVRDSLSNEGLLSKI